MPVASRTKRGLLKSGVMFEIKNTPILNKKYIKIPIYNGGTFWLSINRPGLATSVIVSAQVNESSTGIKSVSGLIVSKENIIDSIKYISSKNEGRFIQITIGRGQEQWIDLLSVFSFINDFTSANISITNTPYSGSETVIEGLIQQSYGNDLSLNNL